MKEVISVWFANLGDEDDKYVLFMVVFDDGNYIYLFIISLFSNIF